MLALHRQEISLETVQTVRKAVLLLMAIGGGLVLVFAESKWPDGGFAHETIELVGFWLIVFCILGRTWCALYIGGLKYKSLITVGPYSVSRNPLYFFSIIGAAGIGAQMGSIVMTFAVAIVVWAVFHILTYSEERALTEKFGVTYRLYLASVPRFIPRFSLWQDVGSLTISPRIVRATFFDACIFLVSIPLGDGFDYLHGIGALPVFFQVP